MKNKNNNTNHSIHQRVEHFCRSRACLTVILGILAITIIKADTRLLGMMRQAYAEGFGLIGMYLREETARMPINVSSIRVTTISGR